MSISLRDIFRVGSLWSSLEDTIKTIKKTIDLHGKEISKSRSNEKILAEQIKYLKQDNYDLRERLGKLEERMWQIHTSGKVEREYITADVVPSTSINRL